MTTDLLAELEPRTDDPMVSIPPSMGERIKQFATLEHERRELEAKLKDIEGRASKLAAALLDDFADNGIQNTRCDGLTIYVRTDRYVSKKKDVETQTICDLLESLGRGDMVSDGYNASSLKSWVLEQIAMRADLRRDIDGQRAAGGDVSHLEERLAEIDQIQPLLDLLNIGEVPRIVSTK
jgi:hypothetical protein